MAQRDELELKFGIGDRTVTVRATSSICAEDCYETLLLAVLHRHVTGEDVVPTIPRDVKDFLIKQNLSI